MLAGPSVLRGGCPSECLCACSLGSLTAWRVRENCTLCRAARDSRGSCPGSRRGNCMAFWDPNPGGRGEGHHIVSLTRDVPARSSFGGARLLLLMGEGKVLGGDRDRGADRVSSGNRLLHTPHPPVVSTSRQVVALALPGGEEFLLFQNQLPEGPEDNFGGAWSRGLGTLTGLPWQRGHPYLRFASPA